MGGIRIKANRRNGLRRRNVVTGFEQRRCVEMEVFRDHVGSGRLRKASAHLQCMILFGNARPSVGRCEVENVAVCDDFVQRDGLRGAVG